MNIAYTDNTGHIFGKIFHDNLLALLIVFDDVTCKACLRQDKVNSGLFLNSLFNSGCKEVAKLGISPTENIIRMERVRYADQVPLVYEVASIPEKFIKDFNKEEITSHFFQTLQKHGYRIGKSQQTIYARLAKEKIAHYLEVEKGHAILGLTQISYLEDGTAFEYVKSQYVGERFEFYLENN